MTGYLTNEKRLEWLSNRTETLEDQLDPTSVEYGSKVKIAELELRRRQKIAVEHLIAC